MKTAFFALVTVAVLAVAPARAQGPASGPSPDVPELAALSGYAGKWDVRSEARRIEGVSEGGVRKGTASAEWIHGGRFLRQDWVVEADGAEAGFSGSTIMTYDPAKKQYRCWQFDSSGGISEGTGVYDEKAKGMTWTSRNDAGFRMATKSSFAGGEETWSITVTDPDGKVVADLKGKDTRRKE